MHALCVIMTESAKNDYYSVLCSPVDCGNETSEYDSVPGESLKPRIKVEKSRLNSRLDPTRLDLSKNDSLLSVLVNISMLNESSGQQ